MLIRSRATDGPSATFATTFTRPSCGSSRRRACFQRRGGGLPNGPRRMALCASFARPTPSSWLWQEEPPDVFRPSFPDGCRRGWPAAPRSANGFASSSWSESRRLGVKWWRAARVVGRRDACPTSSLKRRSMMADDILDPVGFESQVPPKPMAKRLDALKGKKIGVLDIGFPNGNVFLDRVEEVLKGRYGVAEFVRRAKPSPARPADDEVRKELIEACDAIVEGTSS